MSKYFLSCQSFWKILNNSSNFIKPILFLILHQCSAVGSIKREGNFITFSIETKQNEFLQHKNLEFQILFDMKNKYFKHSLQILFLETHTCSLS